MKNYNKILEAVNKGIQLALDDYQDMEPNSSTSSVNDVIDAEDQIGLIHIKKYFVDLGLPSGTLWCKYNFGCDFDLLEKNPENATPDDWFGEYYAWGELTPKDMYSWSNYKFSDGITKKIKYNEIDNLTKLCNEDNVVYQTYNGIATIPTDEQFKELIEYSLTKGYNGGGWIESYLGIRNLNGILFESKINHKSIFMPAGGSAYMLDINGKSMYPGYGTGEYWTSNVSTKPGSIGGSKYFYFKYFDDMHIWNQSRYMGMSIRPVINVK